MGTEILNNKVNSVVDLLRTKGMTTQSDVHAIFESGGIHPKSMSAENMSENFFESIKKDKLRAEVSVSDLLATPETAALIPQVIVDIVTEAAEPMLVLTSLMHRIDYRAGTILRFGTFGAVTAEDVGEAQAYPEISLTRGPGSRIATVGKSGLKVRLTDEEISRSQWDIIGMHLRAAGRGFARHKEQKVAALITGEGATLYSNSAPQRSFYGPTTGRGSDLAANGSMTMKDLFNGMAHMMMQGFMPDTLVVNPMTVMMWVNDPTMQAMLWMASRNGAIWGSWTGSLAGPSMAPEGHALMDPSRRHIFPGMQTAQLEGLGRMQSHPNIPSYFPFPLGFVVSPFIHYDHVSKLTDIILMNRNEAGVIVVEEELVQEEWREPAYDIKAIKLREKYGLAILNRGMGVGVFRDVKLVDNMVPLVAMPVTDVSNLPAISKTIPVV